MAQLQSNWLVLHAAVDPAKTVTVAVTSDRGLCGGLNSNITKYTKSLLNMYKGTQQLGRSSYGGSS